MKTATDLINYDFSNNLASKNLFDFLGEINCCSISQ